MIVVKRKPRVNKMHYYKCKCNKKVIFGPIGMQTHKESCPICSKVLLKDMRLSKTKNLNQGAYTAKYKKIGMQVTRVDNLIDFIWQDFSTRLRAIK